jgi:hypothetical protein
MEAVVTSSAPVGEQVLQAQLRQGGVGGGLQPAQLSALSPLMTGRHRLL